MDAFWPPCHTHHACNGVYPWPPARDSLAVLSTHDGNASSVSTLPHLCLSPSMSSQTDPPSGTSPKTDTWAMDTFANLDQRLATLVAEAPLPSLGEGPEHRPLLKYLESTDSVSLSPKLRSSLFLLAGDLERSHRISQDIEDADGSFLHGIMHRREGDYSNAKYWFRRVGDHPVIDRLAEEHPEYPSGPAFVDAVASHPHDPRLADVQAAEWRSLTNWLLDDDRA